MSEVEYNFLENHRINITFYDKKREKNHSVTGYVVQLEHWGNDYFYTTIYVIRDDGVLCSVTPKHCNVEITKITILDWDPKNPKGKIISEEEARFHLMDIEE